MFAPWLLLVFLILSSCTGKQIIENSNRIKNISNISKSGVKEELTNNITGKFNHPIQNPIALNNFASPLPMPSFFKKSV